MRNQCDRRFRLLWLAIPVNWNNGICQPRSKLLVGHNDKKVSAYILSYLLLDAPKCCYFIRQLVGRCDQDQLMGCVCMGMVFLAADCSKSRILLGPFMKKILIFLE